MLAVLGPGIVPPWRTGWMLAGVLGPDPVQYWLGWAFLRDDAWRLPPGLSPRFGMELSSSVFFADSIPLLALVFKALRPVVTVDQYWGLWLVGSGAAQAGIAALLVRRVGGDAAAQMAGGLLFALQPMLLNRVGGHFALAGQWLLLLGLLLWLAPPRRPALAWAALAGTTALVHSYLLPMVLALWLAAAVSRRAAAEALPVLGTALAGLWAAGFFVLGAGHGDAAYGHMQLDLLAPFDPGYWGAFLPALPGPDHPEIGGSYLGLGGLALLGLAPLAPRARRAWPLVAVLGLMLLFALSHRVSAGGLLVLELPLPAWLTERLGALRASERFVWPLAYALMLAGAAGLVRLLGARGAGLALLALLALQLLDLRPGLARLGGFFPAAAARPPLRLADPAWAEAARGAGAVRAVPAANRGPSWEEVAVFAARHGLSTDAAYLARVDPAAVARLREAVLARLRENRPEPGVLYVLRDEEALRAARAGMPGRLRLLDGLWMVPPAAGGDDPPAAHPTWDDETLRRTPPP